MPSDHAQHILESENPTTVLCRHCCQRQATKPRQLCRGCFYCLSIRRLYKPTGGVHANRFKWHDFVGPVIPPAEPTQAVPGSAEKIAVLARRYARRKRGGLWHPDDARGGTTVAERVADLARLLGGRAYDRADHRRAEEMAAECYVGDGEDPVVERRVREEIDRKERERRAALGIVSEEAPGPLDDPNAPWSCPWLERMRRLCATWDRPPDLEMDRHGQLWLWGVECVRKTPRLRRPKMAAPAAAAGPRRPVQLLLPFPDLEACIVPCRSAGRPPRAGLAPPARARQAGAWNVRA